MMNNYVMTATKPAKGLAVSALVFGIIGFVLSIVPVLGAILGILAIILGAVALKKKQPKGQSVTGIVLGSLATITSVTTTIMLVLFGSWFVGALEGDFTINTGTGTQPGMSGQTEPGSASNNDQSDSSGSPAGPAIVQRDPSHPIQFFDVDTADAPVSDRDGTEENPHLIGTSFTVGTYEVVVNFVDTDADDSLRKLAQDNPPSGEDERYVLINMTLNNPNTETDSVQNIEVFYETAFIRYSATPSGGYMPSTPHPALLTDDRSFNGNFSGYIALRTSDSEGESLQVRWHDNSETHWVAVR